MKAYPAYKESNVEWFGTIPSHWGTVPLKYVCYMKGRIGWQGLTQSEFIDEGPYLITGMNFKNGTMNWNECYHISKERYAEAPEIHVREGDVLITKDGTIGKLLFMDYLPGPTSLNSHLLILRPRNDEFTPKYLYYLLHSDAFLRFVDTVKTGTTFYGITQASMGDFRMLVFDKTEQQAIADFLDHKTEQIDTLIEKKQRQIDLLQEQRTALINHAVTKGLNPSVRMKDSGVEWLGEIPSHWEVSKLKYLVNKIGSGVTPRGGSETYQESGIPFIRSQNVHFDGLRLDDIAFISKEVHESMSNSAIRPNDVLLNITGASIGRCTFVPSDFGEANVNQHVCILRANEKINFQYLNLVLSSTIGQTQVWLGQGGAAREGLNYSNLGNFFVILPPLDEQLAVIERLNSKLSQIDSARKQFQELIGMYQEYRTALISEAVTGKVDVRTAETVHESPTGTM